MRDIVGNALHFDRVPTIDELVAGLKRLSRADLFAGQANSPMLVINGADDYFIPQSDTLVFQGRPEPTYTCSTAPATVRCPNCPKSCR